LCHTVINDCNAMQSDATRGNGNDANDDGVTQNGSLVTQTARVSLEGPRYAGKHREKLFPSEAQQSYNSVEQLVWATLAADPRR
jgi:hypothetical protein